MLYMVQCIIVRLSMEMLVVNTIKDRVGTPIFPQNGQHRNQARVATNISNLDGRQTIKATKNNIRKAALS